MAVCSNKRKKDPLTDDGISKVLDIEDESDVLSEESDDFGLRQVKKIQTEIQIQAVLCVKVNRVKKCQIFCKLLYLMAWCVQDLHFSVLVEWMWTLMMKLMFWNVFRGLLIKICGSCLLNKQIYMPTNFWQQILIWNHDPELEAGWTQTRLKWKP